MKSKKPVQKHSSTKVNLTLSILGRRPDGFHDIHSLVAQLEFGDSVEVSINEDGNDSFECNNPEVPTDDSNLCIQAVELFRLKVPQAQEVGIHISIDKKIPMGAGLGGGSSNGVATLKGLNELFDFSLKEEALIQIAAQLGSDCPLFMKEGLQLIQGRGEILQDVTGSIQNKRIFVFKPHFSIPTPWAYNAFSYKDEPSYTDQSTATQRIEAALEGSFSNDFEEPVFFKYLIYKKIRDYMISQFGLKVHLSGSGSACFFAYDQSVDLLEVKKYLKSVLGPDIFMVETAIL